MCSTYHPLKLVTGNYLVSTPYFKDPETQGIASSAASGPHANPQPTPRGDEAGNGDARNVLVN